jgi:iron complex outermembrane receptor protein
MMRTESVNNFGIKMLPSVSLKYSPFDIHRLTISANVSRNYHMPTMNDLYWEPGGNPDLKAEDGYSYESGLTYKKQMKNINLNASVTGYYSHISNWILWQPDSLASYWTPSNLKQVRSRGIESSAGISGKWQQFIFRLNTGYTLTDAENREKLYDGDKSVGKQLIYVPKHSANAMLYLQYKNWHLSGQYKYTGKRYTSTDNSRYMPDFMLYDAEFGRKFKLGSCLLNAAIKVNNLLDTDYQSVAWYPMPGRIYNLKINFRWKHK